jgi:hypothetical protein
MCPENIDPLYPMSDFAFKGNNDMKTANKSYKIIVDSNIWISFLIGKKNKKWQKINYHFF